MLALTVDDSRAMRTVLARILTSLGFVTVGADNGRAGLAALRAMRVPPDVVLVEWNMPEVDGLEFVSAVRSELAWRAVRIMMVSSKSEQEYVVRARAAGAHEYVVKPLMPDTISERLRRLGLVGEVTGGGTPGGHASREGGAGAAGSTTSSRTGAPRRPLIVGGRRTGPGTASPSRGGAELKEGSRGYDTQYS